MVNLIIVVGATVHSRNLLSRFPLNKPELLVLPPAEERILENEHIVVLLDLVEIVHVELRCGCGVPV